MPNDFAMTAGIRGHNSKQPMFAPHILGAVLNHSPGAVQGITAVYNKFEYADEKRDALDGWADRLLSIVDRSVYSCRPSQTMVAP